MKAGTPPELERAIGSDVWATVSQTGLSREELLARLSRELPEAVNEGRLPTKADLSRT